MERLRKNLIMVTLLALAFLAMQLVAYLYSINAFRSDLRTLEDIHEFVENVLELRRYEKNFAYYVTQKDIDEVLEYTNLIENGMQSVENSPVVSRYAEELVSFKQNLVAYSKLAHKAKQHEDLELDAMRTYGHAMLLFSEKVLDINRTYINHSLKKIMFFPSSTMFLFGGSLIVSIVILTLTIIKQIKFIKATTWRIAQGDFRPIDNTSTDYRTYPLIIKAFNRMINELDLRQEQLLQSKKLAAIGTFASGIAHEVNNPLNNISLTAESILEEYHDLPEEEERAMLQDILSEVTRASKVVNNLLDFSRIGEENDLEMIDIVDVIKATLRLIRNQIMLQGIQLKTAFSPDPQYILGDCGNLKQVFINLCLNAIQSMPEGGLLTVATSVPDEQTVMVQVSDTGSGMSPEMMDKIFDPFFTTKPAGKGTGLGLSVVYGIVKKHAGYIEVTSNSGEGTTFSVFLPRVLQDEPSTDVSVANPS